MAAEKKVGEALALGWPEGWREAKRSPADGVLADGGTDAPAVAVTVDRDEEVIEDFEVSIDSDCGAFRVLLAPAFSLSRGVNEDVSIMFLL